jgi:hypothetical protein
LLGLASNDRFDSVGLVFHALQDRGVTLILVTAAFNRGLCGGVIPPKINGTFE